MVGTSSPNGLVLHTYQYEFILLADIILGAHFQSGRSVDAHGGAIDTELR
jgi:hypothetical protein